MISLLAMLWLAEIIEDDSFIQVVEVVYKFGGVEKDNPRCELEIAAMSQRE